MRILSDPKKFLLPFILLIGLCLRFAGANWGLPVPLHPDEDFVTYDAYKLAVNHSFETKTYNRPNHVSIKANTLIYLALNELFFGTSGTTDTDDFIDHITLFYTASRLFSGFLGVLSIWVAYLIGKRFDPKIGLIAAGLFAVFPSFVLHAHYITPEVSQTFFMLLVAYFALLYFERQNVRDLALMSVSAAFAFCEKYPAVFCCVVIAYTVIASHHKDIKLLAGRSIMALCTFIITIFAISPVLFIDFGNVLAVIGVENGDLHLGADKLGAIGNYVYYFRTYIDWAGILLFCFAVSGIYYSARRYGKKGFSIILGCFYVLPLSLTNIHWERWGVPMYAYLLLLSAIGIYHLLEYVKSRKIAALFHVILLLSFISVFLSSFIQTASFVATDTRLSAIAYCSENGITSKNSYYEGYTPFSPAKPGFIWVNFENDDIDKPMDGNVRYIVLSGAMYDRFYAEPKRYYKQILFYERIKQERQAIKRFAPVKFVSHPVEIRNIMNAISAIARYLRGGNSGPEIVIYANK